MFVGTRWLKMSWVSLRLPKALHHNCVPHHMISTAAGYTFETFLTPSHSIPPLSFSFSSLPGVGAAYGTAKSGSALAAVGVMRPDIFMKSLLPVVMAGIITIYGFVVSMILVNQGESINFQNLSLCDLYFPK